MRLVINLPVLCLALAALAQGDSIRCKSITTGDKKVYNTCIGQLLSTRDSELEAKVDCRGKPFMCSKLPDKLPFAGLRLLENLVVYNCTLNSSLECVLDCLNATGTAQLTLTAVRSQITEETVRSLGVLDFLVIDDAPPTSELKMVPVEAIKGLPHLRTLHIYNVGNMSIQANAFNEPGMPDLQVLRICDNNIPTFPNNSFNGLEKLEILDLHNNNIEEIDIDTFKGLNSLEKLILDANSISSMPARMLHSPRLHILRVQSNRRELQLDAGVLLGLNLTELILQSKVKLKLEPRSLHKMSALQLELQNSGITDLPSDLFHSTTVKNLDLSNNILRSLPETVFLGLKGLEKLDLSTNKLEAVTKNTFQHLNDLVEIYLYNNAIKLLPEFLFSTLRHLETVSFANNFISDIDTNTFHDTSINELDLSQNLLTWKCYNKRTKLNDKSPLGGLGEHIKKLDLSFNNITGGLCVDWMQDMSTMEELNLAHNHISFLQATLGDSSFTSNKITVDLRNNYITTLESIEKKIATENITILVGRNPYNCDCGIYNALKQLSSLTYNVEDANCKLPLSLKDTSLSSLAADNLNSPMSLGNLTCPLNETHNCKCILRPAWNRTECTCSDLQTLPQPDKRGPDMLLTLLMAESLTNISSSVNILNLTSLNLETVPEIPETVEQVYLRNNKLSRVPLELLQRNITIYLEGNPLTCNCYGQNDLQNINDYKEKIHDYNRLLCEDKTPVQNVRVAQLCYLQIGIGIGIPLGFAFLISIAVCVVYAYTVRIKRYIYHSLRWTWLVSEKMVDCDKKWDIFLSFSHANEELKTIILAVLDKYYKVCVHNRDWDVGEKIQDQIIKSVAESRRTVILLSNEFLHPNETSFRDTNNHGWALMEFNAVSDQTAIDLIPRAVVILVGDVNLDTAPDNIKNYLEMNTYSKWENTNEFWKTLHRSLLPKMKNANDLEKQLKIKEKERNLARAEEAIKLAKEKAARLQLREQARQQQELAMRQLAQSINNTTAQT